MRIMQGLGIVALLSLLVACTATGPVKLYEGADRALSELVQVIVPQHIEVMSVDGRDLPSSLLRKNAQLTLLPGEHVLGLRYVDIFQITADQHEVVRSRQAALRFNGEKGAMYRLQSTEPKKLEEARLFAKKPEFSLVSEGGAEPAAVSQPIQSYAQATLLDTINKAFTTGQDDKGLLTNTELLKDIWGRATTEERESFLQWLQAQDK